MLIALNLLFVGGQSKVYGFEGFVGFLDDPAVVEDERRQDVLLGRPTDVQEGSLQDDSIRGR